MGRQEPDHRKLRNPVRKSAETVRAIDQQGGRARCFFVQPLKDRAKVGSTSTLEAEGLRYFRAVKVRIFGDRVDGGVRLNDREPAREGFAEGADFGDNVLEIPTPL